MQLYPMTLLMRAIHVVSYYNYTNCALQKLLFQKIENTYDEIIKHVDNFYKY